MRVNVFVLNTGRCGSFSFSVACRYITNFSSSHESLKNELGDRRFAYPRNHIEVDNRLSWMLGRMENHYGDFARYIHLKRNRDDVAASYYNRLAESRGIVGTYHWVVPGASIGIDLCYDMIDTLTANIEYFLSDKTHVMEIQIEKAPEQFPKFWDWIGAQGNLDKAVQSFSHKRNVSKVRYDATEV